MNSAGWLAIVGIMAALRRRAIKRGSYRVVVFLTDTSVHDALNHY